MSTKALRPKICVIRAGYSIAWDKKASCIILLDKNGQSQRTWTRWLKSSDCDNKKYVTFIRSKADFLDLASLLADLFGLTIEQIEVPPYLPYEAAFKFVSLK